MQVAAVAAEFFAPERQTVVRLGPDQKTVTVNGDASHSIAERNSRSTAASLTAHVLLTLSFTQEESMKIGVPKEIKTNENRIALVPAGAEALVSGGTLRVRGAGGRGRKRIFR